jgi:hypothetical protein
MAKLFEGIKIAPEVVSALGLNNCISVMTQLRSAQGVVVHRNKRPAQDLFNNAISVTQNGASFEVTRADGSKFLVEYCEGAKYRVYDTLDKSKSTKIEILVEGAADEFYHLIPRLEVELNLDGQTATVRNASIINGKPWQEFQFNNRDIESLGCMWMVNNVIGGDYGSSDYITNGTVYDFNRGSGRMDYAIISKVTTTGMDYLWSAQDQSDADTETLSLTIYTGVKETQFPIIVPLKDLFTA